MNRTVKLRSGYQSMLAAIGLGQIILHGTGL